jgi:hypothetical protein
MVLQLVGSIILINSKNEYLVVENIQTKTFSFIKGDKDIHDTTTFETIVREVYNQTGFVLGRDYVIDPTINFASLSQVKDHNRFTYFFVGRTLRDDLYFERHPDYYYNRITFVSFKQLMKIKVNFDTNNARFKLKRLLFV